MKKVLVMVNRDFVLYNFRLELIERLLAEQYQVYISLPYGALVEEMKCMGCQYVNTPIDKRGTNPKRDLELFFHYLKICNQIQPDYVLTYTIKPNIYGAVAASINHIPCIINVSGLGTAVEFNGMLQKLTLTMYRVATRRAKRVFFQNSENINFFTDKKIAVKKSKLLPGSGVNLERFPVLPYPDEKLIEFLFIGRVIKEKGIEEYLEAARMIRAKYPATRFHVLGPDDGNYQELLEQEKEKGTICWHGMVRNVRDYMMNSHCTIHPSYYPEGMSNACLESAASGRPVITTGRSGCRETVEDGKTGFIFQMKDTESLIAVIEKFLQLPWKEKREMGLAGRRKMEEEFNRQIVVEEYMKELEGQNSWKNI